MWKGAKDKLASHRGAFGGVWLLPDSCGNIDKLKLCAGRRREVPGKSFHDRDFSRLN